MNGIIGAMRIGLVALACFGCGCNVLAGLDDLHFGPGTTVSSSAGGTGAGAGAGGSGNAGAGGTAGGGSECSPNLQTDAENCGARGFDCLGANCVAGMCDAPVAIAGDESSPGDLETRDGYVYWINTTTGALRRCTAGCADGPETIAVSGADSYYLAVDDENVFWNNNAQGEIWRCPLAGCGGSAEPFLEGLDSPTQVGSDEGDVCWHSNSGALKCINKVSGTQPVTMISGEGNSGDIQPFGEQLFWTSRTQNQVRRCDKDDCVGTVVTLDAGLSGVQALDLDEDFVYDATNTGSGDIVVRMAHDGSAGTFIAEDQQGVLSLVAVDGHVYWANNAGDEVNRVPTGGGALETVASDLNGPRDVGVIGNYAYVTIPADGAVWRYPLPR